MTEQGKFIVGDPENQPPDINELERQYDGVRQIPVIYTDANGVQVHKFTGESLMQAFCTGSEPEAVSDERFRETLRNIASGKGHGG